VFTVLYANRGDTETVQTALLQIYVGDKLEIIQGSIKEKFGSDSEVSVSDSTLSTTNTNGWGSVITYRPRSASSEQGTQTTPGLATIPVSSSTQDSSKIGVITFTARLKNTVTDSAGTSLRFENKQGVYAVPTFGEQNYPSYHTVIVGQPLNPIFQVVTTPRTGGELWIIAIVALLAGGIAGGVYAITRRRKIFFNTNKS
jgi:hypothetical protein